MLGKSKDTSILCFKLHKTKKFTQNVINLIIVVIMDLTVFMLPL